MGRSASGTLLEADGRSFVPNARRKRAYCFAALIGVSCTSLLMQNTFMTCHDSILHGSLGGSRVGVFHVPYPPPPESHLTGRKLRRQGGPATLAGRSASGTLLEADGRSFVPNARRKRAYCFAALIGVSCTSLLMQNLTLHRKAFFGILLRGYLMQTRMCVVE